MNSSSTSDSPLVCQRHGDVFDPGQQERPRALWKRLSAVMEGKTELPDGYAFRFPAQDALILSLAEFITLERLCCSFFHFALEVEPEAGLLWLRLTGPAGIKEFFDTELETKEITRVEADINGLGEEDA